MSMFPITGHFVGDFLPMLVAVDTEDTMDEFAEKVAFHFVGRRIPRPPVAHYDVLFHGEVVPPSVTLAELMESNRILPLQWFDVRFREPAVAPV